MRNTIRRAWSGNLPFYVAALIALVGGLVRTKVIAEGLGVAGSGHIGQLSTAVAVLGLIAFLSMWGVAARELSADVAEGNVPNRTFSLLLVILGGNLILSAGVLGIAFFGIEVGVFGANSWGFLGLVALAITSAWMNAAMVWWRVYHNSVACLVSTAVANLASIALSWYGGEVDSIRYVELGLFCTFAIPALIFAFGSILPFLLKYRNSGIQLSRVLVRSQVRDGLYSMSASLSRVGADLASRSLIIASLGSLGNGLIQPYYMYSGVLITQFISIAQTAIIGDAVRRNVELLVKRIAVVASCLVIGAVLVTSFGIFILEFLFSSDFTDAYPSFSAGAWAEVGRWVCIIATGILVARGKMLLVAVVGVLGAVSRLLVVIFYTDRAGLMSIPYSVLAETVFVASMLVLLARRELGRGVVHLIIITTLLSLVGVLTIGGVAHA